MPTDAPKRLVCVRKTEDIIHKVSRGIVKNMQKQNSKDGESESKHKKNFSSG